MGALPQQEAGHPLFARGADHQVGVGLALGVEVLGDVLHVDHLGELLDRRTLLGVLVEHRADGVGELAAAAVRDGDVDRDAVDLGRAVGSGLEPHRRGGGRRRGPRPDGPASDPSRRAPRRGPR